MPTDYKKIAGRPFKTGQQISEEMKPTRDKISPQGAAQRTINDYSKMSPADASGRGQIGLNIFSMGKNSKGPA
jgi:hypothetical protein